MKKKLTPKKIYLLLIAIIIALSAGLVASQQALEKAQKEIALENVQDWHELRDWARNMHLFVREPKDLAQIDSANYDFFLQEHILKIKGDSSVGTLYFLNSKYPLRLIQGLYQSEHATDTFTAEEINLGFHYYMDMNQELENLCESVIQRCLLDDSSDSLSYDNLNWDFAKGLADPDSEIFKEVSAEIIEYTDKWTTTMKEFFKE